MENENYNSIVNILMQITQDGELGNIVFVSGGIVPWLVSKNNSNRNHGDIDMVVSKEDMPKVRNYLVQHNLYDQLLDS